MADTSPYMQLTDASALLDEVWEMDEIVQEGRFGTTAQHIKKETQWKGGALHKKMVNMVYSGARATATLEDDAPDAVKINLLDVQIEEAHLRRISFTLEHTIPVQMEVDGSEHATYNLARELALQANESVGEKRNLLLNSDANARKCLVAAKYKHDGDTYPGGTATTAFLKIDSGSISGFHQGEILDIHSGSTAAVLIVAQVNDVIHDTYMFGRNVGPGIVVTRASDYSGSGTENHFDNVADNDMIVNRAEVAGCGYHAAFNSLMDITVSPGAYFGVTRTTAGNRFLLPYGHDYSTAGTYGECNGTMVTLDLDAHFGPFADVMGMLIPKARQYRKNQGFQLTDAMVCQAQPSLVNEVVRQAGQGTARFTRAIASELDAASRANLVAVSGWNGAVLMNPNLPPIVVQPEPLAPANTIRIFEPSCWEFIRMGSKTPQFIKAPNGDMWHVRRSLSTGNLTMKLDASGYVIEAPFCDQPRLNYIIMGVKSSI